MRNETEFPSVLAGELLDLAAATMRYSYQPEDSGTSQSDLALQQLFQQIEADIAVGNFEQAAARQHQFNAMKAERERRESMPTINGSSVRAAAIILGLSGTFFT